MLPGKGSAAVFPGKEERALTSLSDGERCRKTERTGEEDERLYLKVRAN